MSTIFTNFKHRVTANHICYDKYAYYHSKQVFILFFQRKIIFYYIFNITFCHIYLSLQQLARIITFILSTKQTLNTILKDPLFAMGTI